MARGGVRMSVEEFKRQGLVVSKDGRAVKAGAAAQNVPAKNERGMNKLEVKVEEELLLPLYRSGNIERPRFEDVKLRNGDRSWYTPDFELVRASDHRAQRASFEHSAAVVRDPGTRTLWFHINQAVSQYRHVYIEAKGHWEDDARTKIKSIAARYPERLFVAVQWKPREGGWVFEVIKSR